MLQNTLGETLSNPVIPAVEENQHTASQTEHQVQYMHEQMTVPASCADTISHDWFVSWFNSPIYLKLYEHRNFKEAEETIEMIWRHTGLEQKQYAPKVLDIACGAGRHVVALAKKGGVVVANDLSALLLQEARRLAEQYGVRITFSQNDMREISAHEEFDLVVQLFTSFGYFENCDDDTRVLENVYRALKIDGIYVLDFFNATVVQKTYKPLTRRMIEGIQVSEERSIVGDRIRKIITLSENGNIRRFVESVRMYSRDELVQKLCAVGFRVQEVLGDYDGSGFVPEQSPRVIIFAKK
jgi:ubiquinone/menaquinone biosynthesis C-methylase UbiE